GDSLSIYPGELIDRDSSVTQRAIGSPYCFTYKLKGKGEETWEPRFSYCGFRYVQLVGAVPDGKDNPDGLPVIKELDGLHTRNSAEKTGSFSCSNDLFNRTCRLIDWAIKSNMASVLTDCPHREKLGWLEQTYLMGPSIQFNYDISRLYTKTVNDMKSVQVEDGLVPAIAPEYCVFNNKEGKPTDFRDSPEWGSAYVILPWYMYQWYGDKRLLEENYTGMKKYVGYLGSKANNFIVSHGLGDWYDLGPGRPGYSQLTSKGVTGTATWYYDVQIMVNIAKLLDKKEDVVKFNKLAEEIKTIFNQTYFKQDSDYYDRNSQTANAMPIYTGLTDPQHKNKVLENLIKEIRGNNNTLTTGDIGYRYLLQTLEDNGASNVIYDMNYRSDVPGYGYQLAKGATALTESWQALPSVSNNHLMLGHLMEWFYSGIAGIRQEEGSVAYKHIVIKPEIVGNITEAKASYHSMYGTISSEWEKAGDAFNLKIQIPVNTDAFVYLPASETASVTVDEKPVGNDIQFLKKENGRLLYKVGSGTYSFKVK
ncbi:MAG TPA: family 78 glycoside hydrolase catalytic domain, partial [Bacteroidales bacterium]